MKRFATRRTCRATFSMAVPRVRTTSRHRLWEAHMLHTALASLATAACLLALTACNGDNTERPTTSPTLSDSPTSPSSSPSSSPSTPSVSEYLVKYSEEEREAYEAAVEDYATFSDRNAELYRVGRATSAAKAYYMKSTSAWQTYWAKLREFDSQGIRVVGRGEVIRIRPSGIRVDPDGGGQVDLRVCGVSTGVQVIQNGEVVPQPSPKPTTTRVRMVKLPGASSWRILFDRVGSPC